MRTIKTKLDKNIIETADVWCTKNCIGAQHLKRALDEAKINYVGLEWVATNGEFFENGTLVSVRATNSKSYSIEFIDLGLRIKTKNKVVYFNLEK